MHQTASPPESEPVIWTLLAALAAPQDHAVTIRDGEIIIAPIADLEAAGIEVRG